MISQLSPDGLQIAAGQVIYTRGETAPCAYLVLQGAVELRLASGESASIVRRAGEIFGDLAIIDDSLRRATAVALVDTDLLAITSQDIASRLESADPLLRLWLGSLVSRFSESAAARCAPARQASRVLPVWTAQATAARHSLSFESELRHGIRRGELVLHFQPIVDLASGRLAGFEALIRWQHPVRGLLQPDAFIPFAEAAGVISDITTLCLEEVVRAVPALRAAAAANEAVSPLFVSVNVSGVDLMQEAFAARTISRLCDAGVEPYEVRLEVTESILMKDAERCARTLENCRDQGLKVAIDDFGTGYSSLHYLTALPIAVLKIDRSFCQSLVRDAAGRKIISAILHLGRELGLSIIAEGVETAMQRDLLCQLGCGFGQGYLFGRPLDRVATLELIKLWRLPAAGGENERQAAVAPAA